MNYKFSRLLGVVAVSAAMLFSGCMDDIVIPDGFPQPNLTRLNIRMTDAPTNLEEVNIDLRAITIKGPGASETIELTTNAGIYNLLDYQNGIDTLIASAMLEIDEVRQIRLILGENNTVKVNGEIEELFVPSGAQSGLKILVCLNLEDILEYDLILDFDAQASIHQTGNGRYMMRPVIKPLNEDALCGDDEDEGDDDDDDEDDEEDDEEGLSFEDLPEEAQEFLSSNFGDYIFDVYMDTLCGGAEVFRVEAMSENDEMELFFSLEGEFIQARMEVTVGAGFPPPLQAAVEAAYPGYELEQVFRLDLLSGAVNYELLLSGGDGEEQLRIILDAQGNVVCEE